MMIYMKIDINIEELKNSNLGDMPHIWAEKYGDSIAIVDNNRTTYRDFDMKVTKLANIFIKAGLNKADKVIVQLPNSMFFILTCFALFKIGAIPILAVPGLREKEINNIIEFSEPSSYITTETYMGFNFEEMASNIKKDSLIINKLFIDRDLKYELRKNDNVEEIIEHREVMADEIALFILSGGTTRMPKLIPLKHCHLMRHIKLSAKRCKLGKNTVSLIILPLAHKLALYSPGVFATLSVGGRVVIKNNENLEDVFTVINREKVTVTIVVPSLVKMWLEIIENEENLSIHSLKKIISGGETLNNDIARQVEKKLNCDLIQLYGMSEGVCFTTSLNDGIDIRYSCQGKPLSLEDEFKIIDEKDNEVKYGESGELVFKGPYRFEGYLNIQNDNKDIFTEDGFFRTGDRAKVTNDGNIIIEGRIREQINVSGEKVMPSEVESYLREIEGIKDAAVIGIEDDISGERICAFILAESKAINKLFIYKKLDAMNIGKFKYPSQIEIIDSLPHTNIGKVNKKILKLIVSSK
ncbi:(2,3-dihydroxybenzoyl)adenylate synthase [Clostridium botulinum]|nr:(2,3-dihydroxybenzoyl)adenylate synthase [Clostridium botulinum]NFO00671.1 (2,3-dihydroxybenzoyl)adenylate synthase [Clostridium botulinum]NFO11019.1 (2,3-dihydroxybenzoyl)adenylate synthase [Clostridium botulinum]NFO63287.1 (2,3-dihydroxybenzoyl)adenylate synthase [Clostridium botulinum]